MQNKRERHKRRKLRVRSKVKGTAERPRVSVFRSNSHLFVQIINDLDGKTLVSVSDLDIKIDDGSIKKTELSFKAGELLAQKVQKLKIKKVVFDKAGYKYHGRVKQIAEGMRKGGLEL